MNQGRDQNSSVYYKSATANKARLSQKEVTGKPQRKYSDKSNSISNVPSTTNPSYINHQPMSVSTNFTSSNAGHGKFLCCPGCNYRFWVQLEEPVPFNKNYDSRSSNVEQEDCNVADKIKSHSLLIKSSFKSELMSPLFTKENFSSAFNDEGMNDLLLNLADQKSKLAEALNNNDEFLHKIQKRDSDLKILSQKLFQKDEKINSLQNEIFLLNQENISSKTLIQEMNLSNQNLIKQLNALTKIKLLTKT